MKKVETILKFKNTNLFADREVSTKLLFKWFSEAYKIHFSKVNFVWSESSFIPLSGDYSVLGKTIEIKQYEWPEFMELIRNNKTTLYFTGKIEKDQQPSKYFSVKNYVSRIDYPLTITHLETLGLVKTKESESFIATDPRVFSITNHDTPVLWHEVDILGTPYGNEITNNILELFGKYKP